MLEQAKKIQNFFCSSKVELEPGAGAETSHQLRLRPKCAGSGSTTLVLSTTAVFDVALGANAKPAPFCRYCRTITVCRCIFLFVYRSRPGKNGDPMGSTTLFFIHRKMQCCRAKVIIYLRLQLPPCIAT